MIFNTRPRRAYITITVTVASGQSAAFGGEAYSELKQVRLDPRLKTRSFSEDARPAYLSVKLYLLILKYHI